MITPAHLQICATSNLSTIQASCKHVVDKDGNICGQNTMVKQFCDSHALEYEQDHSKLFQTSKVKMDVINDNREVVAMGDLLVGEILGLYPTYRSVMIEDFVEKEDGDAIKDYDIPKLMSLGYGEECNCVL